MYPATIPTPIAKGLTGEQLADPDVLAFLQRSHRANLEEKQSDPDEWTDEERAAFARGDVEGFSRLRGYTEDEIANFLGFIRLVHVLDMRYGQDFACALDFELQQLSS